MRKNGTSSSQPQRMCTIRSDRCHLPLACLAPLQADAAELQPLGLLQVRLELLQRAEGAVPACSATPAAKGCKSQPVLLGHPHKQVLEKSRSSSPVLTLRVCTAAYTCCTAHAPLSPSAPHLPTAVPAAGLIFPHLRVGVAAEVGDFLKKGRAAESCVLVVTKVKGLTEKV